MPISVTPSIEIVSKLVQYWKAPFGRTFKLAGVVTDLRLLSPKALSPIWVNEDGNESSVNLHS